MLASIVREIRKNPGAFYRVITPLARARMYTGPVLGFDTEYDSKTRELVCWQVALATAEDPPWGGVLRTDKLTVDRLAKVVRGLVGDKPEDAYLVSFFSIAELQFLPVRSESFGWREYGSGSFDCSFYSDRWRIALHVFDVARFFDRQPLTRVAQAFDLEKLGWKRERVSRADLTSARFRRYALHDAGLVGSVIQRLRSIFAGWEVDPLVEKTAASTAASVFRRGWVKEEIYCDNKRARLAALFSCWGGRAEALARGSFSEVYEYDLSSAYPRAALAFGELPCAGSWSELSSLRGCDRWKGGVLRVQFAFPAREIFPCLPVVLPQSQIYPLEGVEWVTLHEARQALAWGAKLDLIEGWVYKRGTTVLSDFLSEMLEKRAKAQGAQKVAYKLLCNSLIGKLAQRVSSIPLDKLREQARKAGILHKHALRLGPAELELLGIRPEVHIGSIFMPEWNALITGLVRARIGEIARATEAIYIATDAVWTREKIKKLPSDLELKRTGRAIVARTRLGLIEEAEGAVHLAHHSIWNRKAAEVVLRHLERGSLRYPSKRPIKIKESLRKGLPFGDWVTEWRTADTYWDDKRRLLPDGSTLPWRNVDEYIEESERNAHARREARKGKGHKGRTEESP